VGVEPGDGAASAVANVFWIGEVVAFVFVDEELGFDAKCFDGVPEFVGLWRWTFAVAITNKD
jgi:hypothetical protein